MTCRSRRKCMVGHRYSSLCDLMHMPCGCSSMRRDRADIPGPRRISWCASRLHCIVRSPSTTIRNVACFVVRPCTQGRPFRGQGLNGEGDYRMAGNLAFGTFESGSGWVGQTSGRSLGR